MVSNSVSLYRGGHSRNFRLLADALADRGHSVTLLTAVSEEGAVGDTRCRVAFVRPRVKPRFAGFALGVDRWLHARNGEFDVVHVNGHYAMPYVFRRPGERALVVRHLRGTNGTILRSVYRDEYFRWKLWQVRGLVGCLVGEALDRLSMPSHDHVFANCGETRAYALKRSSVTADGVSVLPAGVAVPDVVLDAARVAACRRRLGLGNHYVISCLANMSMGKGWAYLCRIAGALRGKGVSFVLLLVGDGRVRELVRGDIRRHGLEDRTIFAGAVQNDANKATLLQAADLFLYPSSPGTTVLEAVAAGVPVVIARRRQDCSAGMDWGPLDVLGVGRVFTDVEPEKVAAELCHIVVTRARLGSDRGVAYCRRELTWEAIAATAEETYRALMLRVVGSHGGRG